VRKLKYQHNLGYKAWIDGWHLHRALYISDRDGTLQCYAMWGETRRFNSRELAKALPNQRNITSEHAFQRLRAAVRPDSGSAPEFAQEDA
jgi:hypothetical protein